MTEATQPTLLDMDRIRVDPAVALRIPAALAIRRQLLPFSCRGPHVFVAVPGSSDAPDAVGLQAIGKLTGLSPEPRPAEPGSLSRAIARIYSAGGAARPAAKAAMHHTDHSGSDAPPGEATTPALADLSALRDNAVELGNELLRAAILRQASDIHIEPGPSHTRVRFRVDGELRPHCDLPPSCLPSLVSRFKVLAGMDIAEKRSPQDGGFSHRFGGGPTSRRIDIRAASLPTRFGERFTLRLLAVDIESLTLDRLGMSPADLELVHQLLHCPSGLFLLTGPTGSGKTTTLYAMIRRLLAGADLNIITVEDPIEYEIPGVSQVEIEAGDKVNFAKALRSILRHDPDVLMIGEIRDAATLDVAVKASLTGHMVLSTLHTNSAAGAVTRLADMGAERYLIAATTRLCVAQRLVRRLCPQPGCQREHVLTPAEAAALGRPDAAGRTVAGPGGCVCCEGRGTTGRAGLFELMPVNAELAARITAGAAEEELEQLRQSQGRPSLRQDAAAKVLAAQIAYTDAIEAVEMY